MKKLLLVCTGNTCRSSMGEKLLQDLLQKKGVTDWEVFSAGIFATPNAPASPQAIEVMREHDLDLSGHRATQLAKEMVADADLIVTMTARHKSHILQYFPEVAEKTFTLKELSNNDNKDLDISDPFGGGVEVYRRTAAEMKEHLEKVVDRIRKGEIG